MITNHISKKKLVQTCLRFDLYLTFDLVYILHIISTVYVNIWLKIIWFINSKLHMYHTLDYIKIVYVHKPYYFASFIINIIDTRPLINSDLTTANPSC